MKRKIIVTSIFFFSIFLFILLCVPFVNNYNDYLISENEYEEIKINRKLNNYINIDINFDEYELIKDDDNSFYYSLREGSSSAYNPKVSINSSDYNICIFGNEITDNSIENNIKSRILVYNDKEYKEYKLVCTTLPIISIDTKGKEIGDEDAKGEFYLFDNRKNSTQIITTSDIDIHVRGSIGSHDWKKHNYKITLTNKSLGGNKRENSQSLLGMRKDGDYILYSMYNDREMIREVFTTNLWKESCALNNSFNIENGGEYKYAELILNGKYNGLYALGYRANSKNYALKDNDVIYKCKHASTDLLSYVFDGNKPFNDYEIKNKGKKVKEVWAPLNQYFSGVLYSNPSNFGYLYDIVDIDNNIDIYLFVNLIQGFDHYKNEKEYTSLHNFNIIAKYEKQNGYRMLFYPYDFDITWGKDNNNFELLSTDVIMDLTPTHRLIYFDNSFKQIVKKRYRELRDTEWSNDYINTILNEYENEIFNSGAYIRDKESWPSGANHSYLENSNDKLSYFKEYVLRRFEHMDSYIENM